MRTIFLIFIFCHSDLNFIFLGDTLGIFEASLGSPYESNSQLCSNPEVKFTTYPIKLVIERAIQLNITSPYVITVTSNDSVGNTDSTEISIEFIAEDLLPPKFDHEFYYATIQNPEFSEQVLDIEPSAIVAIDGDTTINEEIVYEISQQTCKFCTYNFCGFF